MLAGNWRMMTGANLRESAEFNAVLPSWKRLADHSLAPAGLNAPELILPLLRHLAGAELATVKQGNDLLFALPVKKRRSIPALSTNWITPLTVIGEPHLDREFPEAALTTFINRLPHPLLLQAVAVNGPFWNCLVRQDSHHSVLDTWQRAALRPSGTYETWLDSNIGPKRRKEYRRLANRLSELGGFEISSLAAGRDSLSWAVELLALEAAGWKGKRGTAMTMNRSVESAYIEACKLLSAAGKLRFWKLAFNGKPIAIMHAIVEGNQAWLGKIAYDENYAKYSPGVLLVLHATEKLFAENGIVLVDSCAIPGHPMMEHVWRDRLEVADVMIAPKSISARRFALTVSSEKLRRAARGFARDIYYYLKGKKRS
jgi:CelD/BcsL family acetyltransferase involved in cellulose biosynthesis